MIEFVKGDMFTYNLDILVNTVNCVGVMGKGIALEFKRRFPVYYIGYRSLCQRKMVKPGQIPAIFYNTPGPIIISFPTKDHWRQPSNIEWIKTGLEHLKEILVRDLPGKSVGIPALGCSNGGLSWKDVKPLIIDALKDINEKIVVFEPLEGKYEQSVHQVLRTDEEA